MANSIKEKYAAIRAQKQAEEAGQKPASPSQAPVESAVDKHEENAPIEELISEETVSEEPVSEEEVEEFELHPITEENN